MAEILAVGSDITRSKIIEQTLLRQKALFSGIARIFQVALTCKTEEELGGVCLSVAEEITESKFDELVKSPTPSLRGAKRRGNLPTDLVGEHNACIISLNALSKEYHILSLFDRMVNVSGEADGVYISSRLSPLIGSERHKSRDSPNPPRRVYPPINNSIFRCSPGAGRCGMPLA